MTFSVQHFLYSCSVEVCCIAAHLMYSIRCTASFCMEMSIQHFLYSSSCTVLLCSIIYTAFPVQHALDSIFCTVSFCTTFPVQHLISNILCTAFSIPHFMYQYYLSYKNAVSMKWVYCCSAGMQRTAGQAVVPLLWEQLKLPELT